MDLNDYRKHIKDTEGDIHLKGSMPDTSIGLFLWATVRNLYSPTGREYPDRAGKRQELENLWGNAASEREFIDSLIDNRALCGTQTWGTAVKEYRPAIPEWAWEQWGTQTLNVTPCQDGIQFARHDARVLFGQPETDKMRIVRDPAPSYASDSYGVLDGTYTVHADDGDITLDGRYLVNGKGGDLILWRCGDATRK